MNWVGFRQPLWPRPIHRSLELASPISLITKVFICSLAFVWANKNSLLCSIRINFCCFQIEPLYSLFFFLLWELYFLFNKIVRLCLDWIQVSKSIYTFEDQNTLFFCITTTVATSTRPFSSFSATRPAPKLPLSIFQLPNWPPPATLQPPAAVSPHRLQFILLPARQPVKPPFPPIPAAGYLGSSMIRLF